MVRELHPVPDPDDLTRPLDIARREVLAAVDLVASGGASRVAIANLAAAEAILADALADAQAAGVAFRIVREGRGSILLLVGPSIDG